MLKNKLQILVTLIFVGFIAWWISFQHVVLNQGLSIQWFGGTYGIIALLGSIIGFIAAFKWGGYKTVLGKALIFFSLGLLAQEAGQLIATYYIDAAHLSTIPYPSWDDVAYFSSTLSFLVAALFLTKAVGIKFSLRHARYKVVAVLIPLILLGISYWMFLHHHQYDWHHPLTVFFDIGYPVGDASYVSLAVTAYLLSRKMLGGIMRSGILILILGLFVQYIADFTFLYQNSRNTYVPGKYDDLAYFIGYFIMATAMIRFLAIYNKLRSSTKTATPTHKGHLAQRETA